MELFKYLYDHKVGLQCAVFWAAWAWTAEKRGEWSAAEKIFKKALGVEGMCPGEFVQSRYRQFVRRKKKKLREEEEEESVSSHRSVLGSSNRGFRLPPSAVAAAANSSNSVHLNSNNNSNGVRGNDGGGGFRIFGEVGASSSISNANNNASDNNNNGGFRIFTEESAVEAGDPFATAHLVSDRVFEDEATAVKENTQAAEVWNGRGGLSSSTPTGDHVGGGGFAIFVDEAEEANFAQMTLSERYNTKIASTTTKLKERAEDGIVDKLQFQDPLKLVRARATKLGSDRSGGGLVVQSKKDISLEEQRAVASFYTIKQTEEYNSLQVIFEKEHDMSMSMEDSVVTREEISNVSSTVDHSRLVGGIKSHEDETINAKVARMDISMMFCDDPTPMLNTKAIPHTNVIAEEEDEETEGNNDTATFSIMGDLLEDVPVPKSHSKFGDISCIHPSSAEQLPDEHVLAYDVAYRTALQNTVRALPGMHTSRGNLPTELLKSRDVSNGCDVTLGLGARKLHVHDVLGAGNFGRVYLCDQLPKDSSSGAAAVKVQQDVAVLMHEYSILHLLSQRVGIRQQPLPCPIPRSFCSFRNGAVLEMSAGSTFNLNDVCNAHEGSVGEVLSMHYAIQMCHIVEVLHYYGHVLHADIKGDNWVLGNNFGQMSSFLSYTPKTQNFSEILLIDFGRSIDLDAQTSSGTGDTTPWKSVPLTAHEDDMAHNNACMRIKNGDVCNAWDVDAYGLCGSIHLLLFGVEIGEVIRDKITKRYRLSKAIRRYWQKDLWSELFDVLLNVRIEQTMEHNYLNGLRSVRKKMEEFLMKERKQEELNGLLKRQSILLSSNK